MGPTRGIKKNKKKKKKNKLEREKVVVSTWLGHQHATLMVGGSNPGACNVRHNLQRRVEMCQKKKKKKKKKLERDIQIERDIDIESEVHSDWWDEFSNRLTGSSSQFRKPPSFLSFSKISRKTFNYIVSLVQPHMTAKQVNLTDEKEKLSSLNDRVAIALRRLSSGESLKAVGDLLGMNKATVGRITKQFIEAMEESGTHHLSWPSTDMEIKEIKSKFRNLGGHPNCCGVIDTTHVLMNTNSGNGSDDIWRDRENNHSMVIQAIVGPDMRFHDIVTGWPGSFSDSVVLKNSAFFKLAEEGKVLNGEKIGTLEETKVGEYIVGDSAFPLMPWLLTPYRERKLSEKEAKFNKRINATLIIAQRALAKLKWRWRVINGVMWRPRKDWLPRIVLVCCILHNIVLDLEGDDVEKDEEPFSNEHDPGYHQQVCKFIDKKGSDMTEKLRVYLSGRLPS